jgi:phosphoribosylformimino-5-aminoimidazole carboxamide ribotide isomerase
LDGLAVHAVKGERKEYKPLKSIICDSADPLIVAKAFEKLGFKQLYIADLNAITNNSDNLAVIEQIAKQTSLQLMVDAGVTDIEKAQTLLQHGASKVIVGTETLTDMGFVGRVVHVLGAEYVVVSLDMKNGLLIAKFNTEKRFSPFEVLRDLQKVGLTQVILLDLARVGSGEGIDWAFLRTVKENVNMRIYVGGGLRGITDLQKLSALKVEGALIATSLHSGRISMEEIRHTGISF